MTRLEKRFADLKDQGHKALVTYVMAGDPDFETSRDIFHGLANSGADVIEFGMPFSDPMADGPSIQLAAQRALKAGMTLRKVLEMVAEFREKDNETPIVLMGYYNPIYAFGPEKFTQAAKEAGVDGLIVVDLPPEEKGEFAVPAQEAGLNFIFLTTPTSDDKRLETVLESASGFVYYVSITGVTGAASAVEDEVKESVERIRKHTDLPVAIGFGIKTPEQAKTMAGLADAAVVGSAIVNTIAANLDEAGKAGPDCSGEVLKLVADLAEGVRAA